ncbi:MAG: FKBP-type peptidyl-prolyl cis-trans isomerase [Bacteroidales bacterium]
MMKRICFILFFASILTSCLESDRALTVTTQEEAIDKYITNKLGDYEVVRNGGSNRVILSPGEGLTISGAGDSISFYYEGYVFNSGKGIQFSSGNDFVLIGKTDMISGLENGLTGMKNGEESYIIFSAKYGFYKEQVGMVPPMSPLIYYVKIDNIKENN